MIVVAPCCHKQIRKQIEIHKTKNELDFLLKHGIFLERQAEMVTDGIRALILEYYGYSTKIVEFVSDSNTPKNVMIVAEKKSKTESQRRCFGDDTPDCKENSVRSDQPKTRV